MKGWTKKPCHSCGRSENYAFRPVDMVCDECAQLMEEGRQTRKQKEKDIDLVPALLATVSHWNGYISIKDSRLISGFDGAELKYLHRCLYDLAESFCIPANKHVGKIGGYENGEYFLNDQLLGGLDNSASIDTHRLCKRDTKEAFQALYKAINDSLHKAYHSGKSDGENILLRLHSGEINVNEYNKELNRGKQ